MTLEGKQIDAVGASLNKWYNAHENDKTKKVMSTTLVLASRNRLHASTQHPNHTFSIGLRAWRGECDDPGLLHIWMCPGLLARVAARADYILVLMQAQEAIQQAAIAQIKKVPGLAMPSRGRSYLRRIISSVYQVEEKAASDIAKAGAGTSGQTAEYPLAEP